MRWILCSICDADDTISMSHEIHYFWERGTVRICHSLKLMNFNMNIKWDFIFISKELDTLSLSRDFFLWNLSCLTSKLHQKRHSESHFLHAQSHDFQFPNHWNSICFLHEPWIWVNECSLQRKFHFVCILAASFFVLFRFSRKQKHTQATSNIEIEFCELPQQHWRLIVQDLCCLPRAAISELFQHDNCRFSRFQLLKLL